MNAKMRIAWVTVNYNQQLLLPNWIHSIETQDGERPCDIFIVDNSDTIKAELKGAAIIRPRANLGYFPGFNCALRQMDVRGYDAIIMSNPDIIFDRQFARKLMARSCREDRAMVIAPRITANPSGVEQNPHVVSEIGWLRRRYYDVLFSSYPAFLACQRMRRSARNASPPPATAEQARAIYMAHGSCFILLPSFFESYDRLDDRVFLWGEEALLRKQVADAGGVIFFDPSLRATHHEHSATAAIASKEKFLLMKQSYAVYRSAL